ncbi:hypothetical protein DF19_10985 [Streptomyces olindensis]|nr:hypothetical protein DF19_10985 [Streptomyces olindensis]
MPAEQGTTPVGLVAGHGAVWVVLLGDARTGTGVFGRIDGEDRVTWFRLSGEGLQASLLHLAFDRWLLPKDVDLVVVAEEPFGSLDLRLAPVGRLSSRLAQELGQPLGQIREVHAGLERPIVRNRPLTPSTSLLSIRSDTSASAAGSPSWLAAASSASTVSTVRGTAPLRFSGCSRCM